MFELETCLSGVAEVTVELLSPKRRMIDEKFFYLEDRGAINAVTKTLMKTRGNALAFGGRMILKSLYSRLRLKRKCLPVFSKKSSCQKILLSLVFRDEEGI